MKNIVIFTGGGSGGHVIPALTLIGNLKNSLEGSIHYVGSQKELKKN